MTLQVAHIAPAYPTAVPVPIGLPEALVKRRVLKEKYEVNPDIKTVSIWLLLKSLTKSGLIKNWWAQKDDLLPFLHICERTFYSQLHKMQKLGLISEVDAAGNIRLISYEKAAALFDVAYSGMKYLPYNYKQHAKKQSFQYLLRAEEIRTAQSAQLCGLHNHLDKNPSLKTDLHQLLHQHGADMQRLYKEPKYYQECLLQLQKRVFREGSAIIDTVFIRRADINRSVGTWASHHNYRSKQSVSYLKKVMQELDIVSVKKDTVESDKRSRIYYEADGQRKEGYKWVARGGKTTWFLTDQISFKYEPVNARRTSQNEALAAA